MNLTQPIPASVLLPSTISWEAFFGTAEEINLVNLIYNSLTGTVAHLEKQEIVARLSPEDVADILKSVAEMAGGKKVKATFAKLTQSGTIKETSGTFKLHFATAFAVEYHVGTQHYLWTHVKHLPRPVKVIEDEG